MFKWFGGKQEEATPKRTAENKLGSLKDDAYDLRMVIDTTRHTLDSFLTTTKRATKDERTAIVTSSLQTLAKVNTFLNKVVR